MLALSASHTLHSCCLLAALTHTAFRPVIFMTSESVCGSAVRAHERFLAAAAAGMKRSVVNGSERTDGRFIAAFFQTQHASFSVRCGGRTAAGDGNGTRKNI